MMPGVLVLIAVAAISVGVGWWLHPGAGLLAFGVLVFAIAGLIARAAAVEQEPAAARPDEEPA